MHYIFRPSLIGIRGMMRKRLVRNSTKATPPVLFPCSLCYIYAHHSLMVWILLRLLVGAKCTKVWRWWQSEVQDMRFPSIVHGKPWSFLSISCKISPCLGLYLAFSHFRIFFHLKWKISAWSHVVQFQVRFPHFQLNRFSLFIWYPLRIRNRIPLNWDN